MCAESVSDLLLDGVGLVSFGLDDMYPWLILVHGVQNKLEEKVGG